MQGFIPTLSLKWQLVTIPLVLIYENLFEWAMHKYILHGLGRRRESFWSFHWIDHHNNVKKNNFIDRDYKSSLFVWNAQSKELAALGMGAVIHLPLLIWSPLGYCALVYCGLRYYYVHRKSHTVPGWCEANLPWHYDHHMAPNQNLNWCVTRPWFDWILGTRFIFWNKNNPAKQRFLRD